MMDILFHLNKIESFLKITPIEFGTHFSLSVNIKQLLHVPE